MFLPVPCPESGATFCRSIIIVSEQLTAFTSTTTYNPHCRIPTPSSPLLYNIPTCTMQPRQAAFRLLHRIALQDLAPSTRISASQRILCKPIAQRSFNTSACLHEAFKVPKPPTALPRKAITKPTYELTFTCKPCSVRSTHEVSKQGYHHGSVLISCPGCKNRHVISDHLKVRYLRDGWRTMDCEP